MKRISINIKVDVNFRNKVKILAATKNMSTTDLIIELLENEIAKNEINKFIK